MSFVKIVAFVVIEKQHEEIVSEAFHEAIDKLAMRHLPIFDSSLESIVVLDVANAEEVRQEFSE